MAQNHTAPSERKGWLSRRFPRWSGSGSGKPPQEGQDTRLSTSTEPGKKSGSSLRARLLIIQVGILLAAVVLLSIIAIATIQNLGQTAQQVSAQALREQALNYLSRINQEGARSNQLTLSGIANDVKQVASSIATAYNYPERSADISILQVESQMERQPEGQYSNNKNAVTSIYIPASRGMNEYTIQDIRFSTIMERDVPIIIAQNPVMLAIYFGTPNGVLRYYPNIELGKVLPENFLVTERPWYIAAQAGQNPAHEVQWTDPYVDATGLGLITTVAAPVHNIKGNLLGVVGVDISLNTIRESIETTQFVKNGYSFLIDRSGHAIALPGQGYIDLLNRLPDKDEAGTDLSNLQGPFASILKAMLAGQSGSETVLIHRKELFVAYTPIAGTGWSMGSVAPANEVLKNLSGLQNTLNNTARSLIFNSLLPAMGGLLIFMFILSGYVTNRLVRPIQNLAQAAQRLGAGDFDVSVPVERHDEIGLLAQTFNQMTGQVNDLVKNLEKRVIERTRDLERRSIQLQAAAEVARDSAAIPDLDNLLNQAVNLIRQRFGFYHVGIFLLDDLNEYAMLRAATGDAGRQMLENRHRLKVGETGLVGYATGRGEPRIALDVGADAVHFKNPFLPQTRSEMALPLKIGREVIGALDVQSTVESAFDQEDIRILQLLADQLAVAIQNVRLVEQLEQNLKETQALFQRQVQDAWQAANAVQRASAYEYDRTGVRPQRQDLSPEVLHTLQDGQPVILTAPGEGEHTSRSLLIPLVLRNQVIGVIGLEQDIDSGQRENAWSEDEIAIATSVANQATLTLESARLFEETQQRAEQERLVSEVTARMRQTLDLDSVLQTATREIYQVLGLQDVKIRIWNPSSDTADTKDPQS